MRKNIRHKFYNDHLWVSLAMRKWRSRFTRAQRLSCILAIFYLSMVTNAMFYRGAGDESSKTGGVITLGKLQFSVNDIINGFISSIIVIIPVTLITAGFVYSERKPSPNKDGFSHLQRMAQEQGQRHGTSRKGLILPYWCSYLAWGLVFLAVAISAFFTILYSLEWGRVRSTAWLMAFLFSKFSNVFIVEPLKVQAQRLKRFSQTLTAFKISIPSPVTP